MCGHLPPAEPKAALQTGKALRLLRLQAKASFFSQFTCPNARPRKKGMVFWPLISLGTFPSETTYPAL